MSLSERGFAIREQKPVPFILASALLSERRLVAVTFVCGNSVRNGIIQAAVQRPTFIGIDRRVRLNRDLRDRLANIAMVVNDLSHRKPAL